MKVDFSNTKDAFSHKSNSDLTFSYLIFLLMKNDFMVSFFSGITIFLLKIYMPITWVIRKTIFKQFCGGTSIKDCDSIIETMGNKGVGSILDFSVEAAQKEKDFDKTHSELLKILENSKGNKNIPFGCLKITGLGRLELLEKVSSKSPLTQNEKKEYSRVIERLDSICKKSVEVKTPIFIDAEESWIQIAIDQLAESMMAKYNKKYGYIYTTIQLYRKDKLNYLKALSEKGKISGFITAVKLVRGAYLEKENERAFKLNYPTPMQPNKKATDTDYDEAVQFCVENIDDIQVVAGTHNELSSAKLVDLINKNSLSKDDKRVYFSQLFGMSDNISFNLGAAGYNVAKYLPYGPVRSTLPYLVRRAQENKSVAGQMGKELQLLISERKRRKAS